MTSNLPWAISYETLHVPKHGQVITDTKLQPSNADSKHETDRQTELRHFPQLLSCCCNSFSSWGMKTFSTMGSYLAAFFSRFNASSLRPS